MPLVPVSVDYTDKDFDSIKVRLRNLVRSVFPEWTDFNVANFGNILLELYAHIVDILLFYQDNQARNSRIVTATQRKAILGLVKLIGFTAQTATAATVNLTISIPSATAGNLVFPKGTIVKTQEVTDAIEYQLLADTTIVAGQTSTTASAENSETQEETFISSGLPNQSLVLGSTPFIDGSLTLIATNGAYTKADNFLSSTPDDRHFTITVDQNDRATIRFGNGVNGAIPLGSIAAEYKTGGGSAGRVEQNKLKSFAQSSWVDSLGNTVLPSVTNPSASSGGTDRQSVAQIKEYAPATLRVLTRSVSREDFEVNALRLPSVARALMLTSNEDTSVGENEGYLYIVPIGGGLPSQALKDQVLAQVTTVYPSTLTFKVNVRDVVYKTVNIAVIAYFKANVSKTTAAAAMRANLTAFFAPQKADGSSNTDIDFGGNIRDDEGAVISELALSDLLNVCRDTTGVRKIGSATGDFLLNGVHDDVSLARKEFPKLGTVTITDGDSGATL